MQPGTLSEAQREALRQSRLIAAYKRVFGAEDSQRTEDQNLVWQDLEIAGYFRKPVFVAGKDGALCALRGAYAEGRRSLFLYVEANVKFSPLKEQSQQQQPQRKRRTNDASPT